MSSCSCGVPDCPDLGWPHEWDPIAAEDTCTAQPHPPHQILTIERTDAGLTIVDHTAPHKVAEPYVRWGSGYACVSCAKAAACL